VKIPARVERAAWGVALAVAGLTAATGAAVAPGFQPNIDSAAIDRAIALGQSRDPDALQRFHDGYVIRLNDVLLDRLEIVTEFRRVVLETEGRARVRDPEWGPKQAVDMLRPWRDKVTLSLHVTFPPNNVYRTMPRFDLVLYGRPGAAHAGIPMQPLDLLETPRYVSGQPAPPGTPILAGIVQATFAARPLDPRGVYLAGIAMEGRELRRVEIDFGRLE